VIDARLLTEGMPTREQALQVQRAHLHRFLRDNEEQFAAMPYEPWTSVAPAGFCEVQTRTELSHLPGAASIGLLGAMLDQHVPASRTGRPLLLYPGLLVTEKLHDLFAEHYHCPTALRLPVLDWQDGALPERMQKMLIIGDPTARGPIINDATRSSKIGTSQLLQHDCKYYWSCGEVLTSALFCLCAANCTLRSVPADKVHTIFSQSERGKTVVNAQVAVVHSLSMSSVQIGEELLLDYGHTFWASTVGHEDHCVSCFCCTCTEANPLVMCDGTEDDGSSCSTSRHRLCFPAGTIPTLEDLAQASVRYYCASHRAQSTSARVRRPAAEEPWRDLPVKAFPLSDARGWQKTPAEEGSRGQQLGSKLSALYAHLKHGYDKFWEALRGGAYQIDLLHPEVERSMHTRCREDAALLDECAQLMLQAVQQLAPGHPAPRKLAALKLIFTEHGCGRQTYHMDAWKNEHLCFSESVLMAGCDTVGTHLPKDATIEEQRQLFYFETEAERKSHRLCAGQEQYNPEHFTCERVKTGDIVAFRCDTLHAGPLNDTGTDRIMLFAHYSPYSYAEDQMQDSTQNYPCGQPWGEGPVTKKDVVGAKSSSASWRSPTTEPPPHCAT